MSSPPDLAAGSAATLLTSVQLHLLFFARDIQLHSVHTRHTYFAQDDRAWCLFFFETLVHGAFFFETLVHGATSFKSVCAKCGSGLLFYQ